MYVRLSHVLLYSLLQNSQKSFIVHQENDDSTAKAPNFVKPKSQIRAHCKTIGISKTITAGILVISMVLPFYVYFCRPKETGGPFPPKVQYSFFFF